LSRLSKPGRNCNDCLFTIARDAERLRHREAPLERMLPVPRRSLARRGQQGRVSTGPQRPARPIVLRETSLKVPRLGARPCFFSLRHAPTKPSIRQQMAPPRGVLHRDGAYGMKIQMLWISATS
jgi:hypothetical protein